MPAFTTQIRAQSFVQRMVAKEYRWWSSGKVATKAELDALHKKYTDPLPVGCDFGCDLPPYKKAYRKKCGLANTHFVSAPLPSGELDGGYIWFLLATDGTGEIRKNSKLKDAWNPKQRLVFGDYVLHLAPRHRLQGGGLRWSWYIVPQIQKELERYISDCLKKQPNELGPFFDAQLKRPLHHGVRHYLSRLLRRAHQSFTKMHPGKPWPARSPSISLPFINGFKSDKPKDE